MSRSQIQFLPEAQDDPQRRRPDIRKAKMMLGWEPVVRVTHGWLSVMRWMLICSHTHLQTYCHNAADLINYTSRSVSHHSEHIKAPHYLSPDKCRGDSEKWNLSCKLIQKCLKISGLTTVILKPIIITFSWYECSKSHNEDLNPVKKKNPFRSHIKWSPQVQDFLGQYWYQYLLSAPNSSCNIDAYH